ncbi:hypothetical protein [Nitrosomonas sp.]|uniref:hypothetical protein n=1 Tax=Nitrosomonas sp. TaxID=42353 RepID=UPI001D2CF2AA|nr:hypothetical protein [Nitrosomonas sp.]MBX9637960.1 hypothetical protein [Nitrosomonas sp.]MBY0484727.1 hypothetical protein [Nitrosomonas sp.]
MKITPKVKLSKESQVILDSLQKAVTQALERKRRLGQYAVVWRNGGPVMIGEDAPKVSENPVNRPTK